MEALEPEIPDVIQCQMQVEDCSVQESDHGHAPWHHMLVHATVNTTFSLFESLSVFFVSTVFSSCICCIIDLFHI